MIMKVINEENTQLSLLFDEVVPIPECSGLMEMMKLKCPIDVADRMVQAARVWQQQHPDEDVMEVITPDWQEYIKSRLKTI